MKENDADNGLRCRIKEYIEAKKVSIGSLAQGIGVARTVINHYVTESENKRKVSALFLMLLLAYDKNLSAEWLLRGEGAMFKGEAIAPNEDELNRLRTELIVKEGIIKELRSIILDKKDMKREQLVG